MGWNSWDCFGAGVTEAQTLENADYLQNHLLAHGYHYVTVDIQWYEPLAHTTSYRKNAVLEMDGNGRLLPAGNRFPSTKESRSFKPLADALHARGLKFGLHLLRGIPRQAVAANTPILGTSFHAADIANTSDVCPWNTDMYGVDMTKPGAQEYYDSVLALLASWDLDFIKVDDLSRPYHAAEIESIRKAIDKTGRPILFSTSPGATPLEEGAHVETHANMWRISDDFWDQWRLLKEQFDRLDHWTAFRAGRDGETSGGYFPDADMLPVGNIRAWQEVDKGGWTRFSHDDQVTMMTLWSIARSPLIIGGNLPKNDAFTLSLLTNDEVLAVDQHSVKNRQLWRKGDLVAWVAEEPGTGDRYVALFNATSVPADAPPPRNRGRAAATRPASAPAGALEATTVSVSAAELGWTAFTGRRDLWSHQEAGAGERVEAKLLPHQAALFKVKGK
jgi:hypothetical protein